MPVVPDPPKGSRTVPPSGHPARIQGRINSSGKYSLVDSQKKCEIDLCDLWKTHCPSLPQIRELTKKRKDKIKSRLKEHPDPAWWIQVFTLIEASDFCKGNSSTGWKASFDWIIDNSDNALKVLEGKYSNTGGNHVASNGQNGSRPKTFREIDEENQIRAGRRFLSLGLPETQRRKIMGEYFEEGVDSDSHHASVLDCGEEDADESGGRNALS